MLTLDLKGYSAAARWNELSTNVDPLELARTAEDRAFPGAILPAVDALGSLYWYAAAATGAEWRLLQPLLLAFVGPTVTEFNGQPMRLNVDVPAECKLLASGIYAAAKLVPGNGCEQFAARALARLRQAVALRPAGSTGAPLPTAQLLSRLEMCLAAGDRSGAFLYLEVLRLELRLDTLNLHFLEVRILWTFRAWRELVEKDWFNELAIARKPSAAASAMLEALWHAHLNDIAEKPTELESQYRQYVQALARPLIAQVSGIDHAILKHFRRLEGIKKTEPLTPGVAAQELLDQAAEAPNVERAAEAHAAIAALPQVDRETLLESGAGQRALAEVAEVGELTPTGWVQWLQLLGDPQFTNAAAIARDGVELWPAEQILTQEQAESIADALMECGLSKDRRQSRLAESIPMLVQWVKCDPGYPRGSLIIVYETLLQLFTLLDGRGSAERDASADLMDACLALGMTADRYRRLLADVRALIDPGAGESSIYWLIDLAAILLHHPTPDPGERLTFLNTILGSFQPLLRLLTQGQRASYNRVAAGASWPTLPPPLDTDASASFDLLKNRSIAIYTLEESAGRQAESALREMESSVDVSLAHDHVASSRLIRLARDADIFVMTAASAKHAATDCILANRGDGLILYAPGRGFSGIIRVVEEYAAKGQSNNRTH
jgi:hypothetical protein